MQTFAEINSSTSIKKVMWLWTMGRHNLTNDQTDLVPQHLKCCGHFLLKKRTVKYERILNFLALVAQNQQPCRSKSLSLTHIYTNKQTHIHKQTHTAEGGRADQRGSPDGRREPQCPHTPHVSYVVPSVPSRQGPPTPGTHTHSRIHTHAFHISHPMSPEYDTQTSHTHCVHMWRSEPRMPGHLYISLECVWTVCFWLVRDL